MERKFKFADQPTKVKILYTVAVSILCVTAIVVGIVSAASKKDEQPPVENTPPITENEGSSENEEENTPKPTIYVAPTVGTVAKEHSMDIPVFSATLGEWRIHTGIDISADEGAEVRAVAAGTVSRVYSHPLHGKTVEILHDGEVVSVYSNLSSDGICVKEGDTVSSGAKIGVVGDTSLTELADESHLHFEIKLKGVSVNPLDYISEESKKASLGI
ncbi:MAG: M23 family metallopeptidase [Clostridia bacterium]|nr:M23 family metallopeptidase [Clostridia bacterium]